MRGLWSDLDGVLRGAATSPERLQGGRLPISLRRTVLLIMLLGAVHGFFVGWFALMQNTAPEWRQVAAAMVKVPLLFLLTVVVTFPSLYVFNALVGSRLSFGATLRLVMATMLLAVAVLASFGPILGFFTFSTPSYHFMVALNIVFAAIAGLMGMSFLLRTLERLSRPPRVAPAMPAPEILAPAPGPLEALDGWDSYAQVRGTFRIWVVLFAAVGMQMSWVLRPFVGNPGTPFTWLRPRESNFFQAAPKAFGQLLFGK